MALYFPFSSPKFMFNLLLFSLSHSLSANETITIHEGNFNLSHVFSTFTFAFSPPTPLHRFSRFRHHPRRCRLPRPPPSAASYQQKEPHNFCSGAESPVLVWLLRWFELLCTYGGFIRFFLLFFLQCRKVNDILLFFHVFPFILSFFFVLADL